MNDGPTRGAPNADRLLAFMLADIAAHGGQTVDEMSAALIRDLPTGETAIAVVLVVDGRSVGFLLGQEAARDFARAVYEAFPPTATVGVGP